MNKQQTVWLITRLIGLYFAYCAILTLFTLVGSVYNFVSLPAAPAAAKQNANTNIPGITNPNPTPRPVNAAAETPKTEAEKAKSESLKDVLKYLFLTVLYGAAGWYLIKNGKFLYALLVREESFEMSGDPAESAGFPVSRQSSQTISSINVPSRKEEVTSLNLSEYVPKNRRIEQPEVAVEQNEPPVRETVETVGNSSSIEIKPRPETPSADPVSQPPEAAAPAFEPETVRHEPLELPEIPLPKNEPQTSNNLNDSPIEPKNDTLDGQQ